MDFQTKRAIDGLVNQLADMQDRMDRAERAAGTSQLPNSSLTGGAIKVIDPDGTARGSIGYQPDGTVAVVATNGPPPPAPSAPVVAAAQLALTIVWDGLFAEEDDGDPATQPKDFDHVEVHLSTDPGFEPDADSLRGTLRKPGALVCTPLLASTTYYAVLMGINTSGVAGDASVAASGVPEEVVATDIIDGIVTTLKLADDAVTNAKIANTAVDANKLADGSVSAQKILDDAITAAKIDDGAVTAAALGADAVTAGKLADGSIDASTLFAGGVVDTTALDDDAVTADKIAANTIVAGNISAGAIGTTELAANAVVAGKIAANAITAGKIAAGIITATEIATDTITASQIAAGAIGATELAANSVIAGKIAAGIVDATAIAAGAITTAKLDALAVTAANIAANAITAGKIAAGAVTAAKLEATMIVATELQSTGYVAGTSGWKIDGTGTAEFNDADFRGDVTVGIAGNPQVHVYTDVNTGQVDISTGDTAQSEPGRVRGGTLGASVDPDRQLEVNMFGPRVTGDSHQMGIVLDSQSADLSSADPRIRIGWAASGIMTATIEVTKQATYAPKIWGNGDGSDGDTILFLGPQPTTTGSWVAYTGTTWSDLPLSVVCPPSESMRISIRTVMSNRSTTAATIGISVRVRDATTGTNLRTPSSSDPYDGASVSATGNILAADQPDTWIAYLGANLLSGRAGHIIEFLPYYRLSSVSGAGVSVQANRTSLTVECLVNQVYNGTI